MEHEQILAEVLDGRKFSTKGSQTPDNELFTKNLTLFLTAFHAQTKKLELEEDRYPQLFETHTLTKNTVLAYTEELNDSGRARLEELAGRGLGEFFKDQAISESELFGKRVSYLVKDEAKLEILKKKLFCVIIENFYPDTSNIVAPFVIGRDGDSGYIPKSIAWPTVLHQHIVEVLRGVSKKAYNISVETGVLLANINSILSQAAELFVRLVRSGVARDSSVALIEEKIRIAIVGKRSAYDTYQNVSQRLSSITGLTQYDFVFLKSCGCIFDVSLSENEENVAISCNAPAYDSSKSVGVISMPPSFEDLFSHRLLSTGSAFQHDDFPMSTESLEVPPQHYSDISDYDRLRDRFSLNHAERFEWLENEGLVDLYLRQTIHEVQQTETRLSALYMSDEKRQETSHLLTDWILHKFEPELGSIDVPIKMGCYAAVSKYGHDITWPSQVHQQLAEILRANSKVGYTAAKEEGSLQVNIAYIVLSGERLASTLINRWGVPFSKAVKIACDKMVRAILGHDTKSKSYYGWVGDLGSEYGKRFWDAYLLQAGFEETVGSKMYNIGAGRFRHVHWKNVEYPNEHYSQNVVDVPWDAESGNPIPLEAQTAPAIFTSHTVEHLTQAAVEGMFSEAFRILKKGGVFRITCPNFDYYYNGCQTADVTRNSIPPVSGYSSAKEFAFASFIGESVSQRSSLCVNAINNWNEKSGEKIPEPLSLEAFEASVERDGIDATMMSYASDISLDYHREHLGNHINWWPSRRLIELGERVGFSECYESNYLQSRFFPMRDKRSFDTTHPAISQYVEFIK